MADQGDNCSTALYEANAVLCPEGSVGVRLKLLREAYGISQRELAKRAGITNSSISMIELGQVSPSIQSLTRILAVIPISLSDFFSFQSVSSIRILRDSTGDDTTVNTVLVGHRSEAKTFVLPRSSASEFMILPSDACGVVIAGSGLIKALMVAEHLAQGDIFYVPAKQLHQFVNNTDVPLKLFLCVNSAPPF